MSAIRDYLRQIAGYLILSVLVENLVAKKEYGPYIRLFLNLLLVLMFVSCQTHFMIHCFERKQEIKKKYMTM